MRANAAWWFRMDAYDKFDKRVEGYNKILIRFDEAMAA